MWRRSSHSPSPSSRQPPKAVSSLLSEAVPGPPRFRGGECRGPGGMRQCHCAEDKVRKEALLRAPRANTMRRSSGAGSGPVGGGLPTWRHCQGQVSEVCSAKIARWGWSLLRLLGILPVTWDGGAMEGRGVVLEGNGRGRRHAAP